MQNASLVKRTALTRIRTLLDLAEERALENTDASRKLAKRYVNLAKKMSTHYKVKIPKGLKSKICKSCDNFLIPGINCKVIVASVHGYIACVCECGNEVHVHYKEAKKSNRP